MSQRKANKLKSQTRALHKEAVSSDDEKDIIESAKPTKKVKKAGDTQVPNLVGKKANKKANDMESEESEEHFEDVDGDAPKAQVMEVEKPKTKKTEGKSKAERFDKKKQTNGEATEEQGVIYVGHLPYGLDEDALKKYFAQYGVVQNVHVARSKKTARTKGYAFVEFKNKEVAKIAAENMNGYMLYGKKLDVKMVRGDNIRVKSQRFKYIPFKRIFIEHKNKPKTKAEMRKEVKHLLKNEAAKRKKLTELGVQYEFPGFAGLVETLPKKTK